MTFEELKAKLDAWTLVTGQRLDAVRMNADEYKELFNYARPKLYHPYKGIWVNIPEVDREVRPAHPDWEYFWIGGDLHVKVLPDPAVPKGDIQT